MTDFNETLSEILEDLGDAADHADLLMRVKQWANTLAPEEDEE